MFFKLKTLLCLWLASASLLASSELEIASVNSACQSYLNHYSLCQHNWQLDSVNCDQIESPREALRFLVDHSKDFRRLLIKGFEEVDFHVQDYPKLVNNLACGVKSLMSIDQKIKFFDLHQGEGFLNRQGQNVLRVFLALHETTDTLVMPNTFDSAKFVSRNSFTLCLIPYGKQLANFFNYIYYLMLNSPILYTGPIYIPSNDTILLYSDSLAEALHEAGHAVDYRKHKMQYLEQFGSLVPKIWKCIRMVVTGSREWKASSVAMDFVSDFGNRSDQHSCKKKFSVAFIIFGYFLVESAFSSHKISEYLGKYGVLYLTTGSCYLTLFYFYASSIYTNQADTEQSNISDFFEEIVNKAKYLEENT